MTFECGCKDHDDLIVSLQTELDFYKNEYERLRNQIDDVIKSNIDQSANYDDINTKFVQADANFQTYKKISDDAITNLKSQIEYLNTERLTYFNLWKISQQTINNLEAEINQYLKQSNSSDSIHQLQNQIRASKDKIAELRHEIDSGKLAEMSLEKSKSICEAQMRVLDKKYNDLAIEHKEVLAQLKNMENVLRENRYEASELKKERDECKKQLRSLCEQHRQYQLRESIAHNKIQDAIQMVEVALAEKKAALQREKEIRDECDQLAYTIGRVMEEAGDKVEGNIDEIKTNYSQRMTKLEDIIKKLIVSRETLAKNNLLSKKQVQEMQSNLANFIATNETLNTDLQTASKTIVEMEMKMRAYEKLIACEQATTKESEERSTQFRALLDNNMKLKQKWKDTFNETTEKLQMEILELQGENSRLIAENQKLNRELLKRNKS